MSGALEGLTVLEHAGFVAGPYCGKLLADMGAAVIKLEPPSGDPARRHGPFPKSGPDLEASALFLYLNTNKKSVTLDTATALGGDVFRQLAAQADVVIEAAQPGAVEASGLGYGELGQRNPGLVYLAISPFGQTGPHSAFNASDINTFASGGEAYTMPGTLSQSLFPERGPVRAGGYLNQYDSGLSGALAVLSAVMERSDSGEGIFIDLAQQEAAMAVARELPLQRWAGYGQVSDRFQPNFFAGMFSCSDGYVILAPREDGHWQALCDAMGRPELGSDERFQGFGGRRANAEALNAILREWTRELPQQQIYEAAASRGCPAAAFSSVGELLESPQLEARHFLERLDHPRAGALTYPKASYRMSDSPHAYRRAAPLLGEHNDEVLCGRLGFARREITALACAGVT